MRIRFKVPTGKTELWTTDSDSVLIGRQLPPSPAHLDLRDVKVSGRHARLTFEDGAYFIEDLGSTNGTWIGRKRIKDRVRLDAGAEVRIGETTLLVEGIVGPAPAPASAPPAAACGFAAAPDGPPREVVDARQPMPEMFLAGASLEAARLRLESVYELCAALGEIDSFESLASSLLDRIFKAFPAAAKNGHGGFLAGEDLALKAFRPDDQPPTCSLTLARHVRDQKKGCLWEVGAPGMIERSASLLDLGVQSAMYVPLIWKGEVLGVLYLDATSREAAFGIDDLRLMQVMASQAAMFVKNLSLQQVLQREALVKSRLLAQFPRPIAERLARNPARMAVVSERVEVVTILFADVRGFTKMSAGMEPELVVQMLNDMFHDLTPIVLRLSGTVDKYMGDAILAVFGSPDPDEAAMGARGPGGPGDAGGPRPPGRGALEGEGRRSGSGSASTPARSSTASSARPSAWNTPSSGARSTPPRATAPRPAPGRSSSARPSMPASIRAWTPNTRPGRSKRSTKGC